MITNHQNHPHSEIIPDRDEISRIMSKHLKKTLILAAKILFAGILLGYVISKVHWSDYYTVVNGQQVLVRGFASTIMHADPYFMIGAFICSLFPIIIISIRWSYLLKVQSIEVPLSEVIKDNFLGAFFNNIIPGNVSGDLVKAYYMAKTTHKPVAVAVSVFVDRAIGLFEFALLPAGMIIVIYLSRTHQPGKLVLPAIITIAALVIVSLGLAIVISSRFRSIFRFHRILSWLPLKRHMIVAAQAGSSYSRKPAALAVAFIISLIGQIFFISAIMLIGFSLGLKIQWYQYFLYVPLIYIVAAVPASPGGLGVTEMFYITFFTSKSVSASEILVMALAARIIPMICSLPGVIVALKGPKVPSAEQIEAELTG